MNKELFVSATPHEIKVGMVEDDQLAEVYLERENEYTLAGSIYKGRVTRVLPGMQSAFVDIGLERDAFLYVSDFMELEPEDADLDDAPASPVQEFSRPAASEPAVESHGDRDGEGQAAPQFVASSTPTESQPFEGRERSGGRDREGRGGYRGRRRRGRRDGGHERGSERSSERSSERVSERSAEPPRFSRPAPSESRSRESRPPRDEYGPPPGYQPIILPGESISKYRGFSPAAPVAEEPVREREEPHEFEAAHQVEEANQSHDAIAETFPQDEPLFTEAAVTESPAVAAFRAPEPEEAHEPEAAQTEVASESEEDAWDREQKRLHQMNVAATFGDGAVETEETEEDRIAAERSGQRSAWVRPAKTVAPVSAGGTVEEEEIDEEEAGVALYADELEEDEAFDEMEMEEEIQSAGDSQPAEREIAASAENGNGASQLEAASGESAEAAHAEGEEESDDASEAEAELEEAQAEAEAMLAAEAVGSGTVDAQAVVRAPAATAAYTQRARRPGFDRNRDRDRGRGRRPSGGGGRFRRNEQRNLPLITDLLKEGQEILVQIAKEPIGKKGARITSHIALPGRFLVYMPTVNHTGVSRKIASEEERLRLKRIIQSEKENGHGGFIVRTAAQGADEQELRADIRFLKGLWNEIRTRAEDSKPPALIYHDLNIVERILRDQVTADFTAIWVDTEQEYERILRFANRFQPGLVRRVKLYSKEVPLFEQFGLKDEIDKALKSKVWLKSGGYIVINQTEALVAIDVNTGKYVGKTARLEDTIVKTNVDAIKEIVRQIRLRDLGGIIIIDFIDMDERRNRQKVMQALEEALRADRAPSKVLQFNDFGLVAITRKRVKQSLERTIGTPCPYCESTGYVKSVNTVCNEIYVEMRKLAKELDHTDVMLRVNPEVAKTLKTAGGRWLNELEELTKKTVIVKSDPALHQEQFDIN